MRQFFVTWLSITLWVFALSPKEVYSTRAGKRLTESRSGSSTSHYGPSYTSNRRIQYVKCPFPYINVGSVCLYRLCDVDTPRSWEEARAYCQTIVGGDLAIFRDGGEFADAVKYLTKEDPDGDCSYWLGGTDEETEDVFKWVDHTFVPRGSPYWAVDSGALLPDGTNDDDDYIFLHQDNFYLFEDGGPSSVTNGAPLCQYTPDPYPHHHGAGHYPGPHPFPQPYHQPFPYQPFPFPYLGYPFGLFGGGYSHYPYGHHSHNPGQDPGGSPNLRRTSPMSGRTNPFLRSGSSRLRPFPAPRTVSEGIRTKPLVPEGRTTNDKLLKQIEKSDLPNPEEGSLVDSEQPKGKEPFPKPNEDSRASQKPDKDMNQDLNRHRNDEEFSKVEPSKHGESSPKDGTVVSEPKSSTSSSSDPVENLPSSHISSTASKATNPKFEANKKILYDTIFPEMIYSMAQRIDNIRKHYRPPARFPSSKGRKKEDEEKITERTSDEVEIVDRI